MAAVSGEFDMTHMVLLYFISVIYQLNWLRAAALHQLQIDAALLQQKDC